jgi:ligand-binding sensor domain-containing protein
MLRLILSCLVLLFSFAAGFAQKVSEYKFLQLTNSNGIAGNFVIDMVQDHKGYMWFGTDGGLQRYDGKRFLTFKNRPGDSTAIPYNMVEEVHEDKHKNLWIITADDRIGIFNTSYFTYHEVPVLQQSKTGLMGVKHLLEDNEGNIFLAIELQAQAFYRYSPQRRQFEPALKDVLPPNWLLNDIAYDKNTNRFWMATDSGLAVYDLAQRKSSYRGNNVLNDPIIAKLGNEKFFSVVYVDDHSNVWAASVAAPYLPTYVYHYDAASGEFEVLLPFKDYRTNFKQLNTIFTTQSGRTWFAGLAFLMEYKKGQTPGFDTIAVNDDCNPKSLRFNSALAIYEDRDHNLWVGNTSGVLRFAPDAHYFTNYFLQKKPFDTPTEEATLAILERKNGEIWLGVRDRGLYTLSKDFSATVAKGNPAASFPFRTCWSIYEHSQTGLIWMGTSRGQIAVYDQNTGRIDTLPKPLAEFEGRPAHKIAEDSNGNLWFITRAFDSLASLVKWDRAKAGGDFRKGYQLIATSRYTYTSIMVDQLNQVWVGTYGDGLQKYDANTGELLSRIFPEPSTGRSLLYENSIADIIQYNDSMLVAVGSAISLINIKTNELTTYTRNDGLPSNIISVQRDSRGLLWLGTMESGLGRFNIARRIITFYTKDDGLLDDFFMQGGRYRLSDGRMIFYTSRCIITFTPEEVASNTNAPAATITDFKLLNASLPVDSLMALDKLVLPYDKNSVTIEFSTMNFGSQNKVNYYYQMEGLDPEWIPADETLRAIYNYLPAGKYVFRIKTDNGNTDESTITSLPITVRAVFWRTWWFWALIALVAASVLFLLDRERVKRLVSLQKMRTEIAVNLHKDVSSTLSNINLLSEMARIKADKDLDLSKEYIQQISDKSNRMIVAMNDILWSIAPENDSMARSILRMREFIDELKNRYAANIELVADKDASRVSLDMRKRHEFFIIFKDALRSVVELAEGRDTLIHLDATKSKLVLKLQDATATASTQQAQLHAVFNDIATRAYHIKAETDIQHDHRGITLIVEVPIT